MTGRTLSVRPARAKGACAERPNLRLAASLLPHVVAGGEVWRWHVRIGAETRAIGAAAMDALDRLEPEDDRPRINLSRAANRKARYSLRAAGLIDSAHQLTDRGMLVLGLYRLTARQTGCTARHMPEQRVAA